MCKKKIATREAYGEALADLIQKNENIVVLDADLAGSTKTIEAKKVCPQRHFDMGIAEGNMMSVAAGFAASGKIPFVSSFAMFAAGRAFEQIRNSIGYPHLNVKICATHAGLSVGEDGASHQCNEDLALMRSIPGMMVLQPCDEIETKAMIQAIADIKGPCYVRLGRAKVENVHDDTYQFVPGKGEVLKQGEKVAIIATGLMVQEACKAVEAYKGNLTIVNMHTLKPIDDKLIRNLAETHDVIITCEEHSVIGGLFSAVSEVIVQSNHSCKVIPVAVMDTFGESGKPEELLEKYEINATSILKKLNELL